MTPNATDTDGHSDGNHDLMVAAYRHDAHKLTGDAHENAPETFADVPVNQPVPYGADGDASALSRPHGQPEKTVSHHESNYRLSLVTGDSQYDATSFSRTHVSEALKTLLTHTDPEAMHRAWLTSEIAGGFNESVYYPYTSLKYHTLLVAGLLDNYRDGHEFADLLLVVDTANKIVPYRTIYASERFTLRIDADADGQPWARLGTSPSRSWASTWNRLTAHPLDTNADKDEMVRDANLRRIWSWSTALQYLEDSDERSEHT
ncbi:MULTISPECIES: hypothetical protein [Halorussus]|uniref:hypothetical protein n=1 Tax=Halorussus TaxID=1070314 RepID=UPI000E218168|nr:MULTISPECIES: hypothetical protein [Halorussus]NHN60127.1 hypothetical protein [Halorussus sp. JP-T4]